MVEFAIILPFLLVVGAGVTELGNILMQHNNLTKSVRDSARYLSKTLGKALCIPADASTAQKMITERFPPETASLINIEFTSVCVTASGATTTVTDIVPITTNCQNYSTVCATGQLHIQVKASYNYGDKMWGQGYSGIFFSPTLAATSIMPIP